MLRSMTARVALAVLLLTCGSAGTDAFAQRPAPGQRPSPEDTQQLQGCQVNLRMLHLAIHEYSTKNDGRLPPDLGSVLAHLPAGPDGKPRADADKAKLFVCPADARGKAVTDKPTAPWVNGNTSYEYLGGANLTWSAIPREKLTTTVIAHEKLTGPRGKHLGLVVLVMADGTVQNAPRAAAEKLIAESKKTLEDVKGK